MVDSADKQATWTDQWIAQQRALLEQASAAGANAKESADSNARGTAEAWQKTWSNLGTAWLGGISQSLQEGAAAGGTNGTFTPAAEALDTMRAAWSNLLAQAAAPGGLPDLLNSTPPLGLFREQTEAWRAVAAAQADCQRLEQELAAVMRRVQSDALSLLEQRVQSLRDRGTPVQGFRDLYDLWVECSEETFSVVAHSSAYGHLQSEMGNAAIRWRARVQKVIEQGLRQFDLPTRSELNSVHQQVRQLKLKLAELQRSAAGSAAASSPLAPKSPTARRSAAKPSTSRRKHSAPATRRPK